MTIELWKWTGPRVCPYVRWTGRWPLCRRELWAVELDGGGEPVGAFGPLYSAPPGEPFRPRPPKGMSWSRLLAGERFTLRALVRWGSWKQHVSLPELVIRNEAVVGTLARRREEFTGWAC